MSYEIFIASEDDGENWLICWTGTDARGNNWNVTTNHIHGSELSEISHGPKEDAELIANLLNWYYSDIEKANSIMLADAIKELRERIK